MTQSVFEIDGAIWVTLAELAKRKGVTRPTIGEKVKRLRDKGLLETRKQGRNVLVNAAAYDLAVGEAGDAVKETAAATVAQAQTKSPALRDAQTDLAMYNAELARMKVEQRAGKLIDASDLADALSLIFSAAAGVVHDLGSYSDRIKKAHEENPFNGMSKELKKIANELSLLISEKISEIEKVHGKKAGLKPDAKRQRQAERVLM